MSRLSETFKLLRRINWSVTLAIYALAGIGILFIYSACYFSPDPAIRDLYKRQAVWILAGSVVYFTFAVIDYRTLRRVAWWFYGGTLILLVLVLLWGTNIYGARRWFLLFGVGIQPSEIAKLSAILALARRLSRPGINLGHFKPMATVLCLAGTPALLVLKQPDLGTAVVFGAITLFMIFVAGVPWRALIILLGIGAAIAALLLGVVLLPARLGMSETAQRRVMRALGINDYQRQRLETFLRPDADPLGAGWNKRQSVIAVGSGGPWGKGFLRGTQNTLGFLPRSVSFTDFIFSVIAEEKGFLGAAGLLTLYGILFIFGIRTALFAHDKWGRLLCVGVTSVIFFHVVVNIGMTVGLLPITGLPLPLVSYGGTCVLATMAELGIIQSVYARSRHPAVVFEQAVIWRTG